MKDILYSYQNGNTKVTILTDGTKIREFDDNEPIKIIHPESLDIKITNYCDMNCPYCHEKSTIEGSHADLNKLLEIIKPLPAGVELAIGGGNPLSHPDLLFFLNELKNKNIIANITVNQGHLSKYKSLIIDLIKKDLVKGVGISITNNNFSIVKELMNISNNIVLHLIIGVHDVDIMPELLALGNIKILLLGYKDFGRGIKFHSEIVDTKINDWNKSINKYFGKCLLAFDNLAIEQLKLRRFFNNKSWNNFYMGNDFTFTMYIDAVNQVYAPTSRSDKRISFNELTLLEYFSKRNEKYLNK